VWFLGWTSLFTDAATEMIYPLLPIYLSRVLGAGAASLGVIEGVAEGVNSLLKVASGWWSDRHGRRRPLVIFGYSLSGASRPLIAAAGSWVHVLIIARWIEPERAFGARRGMRCWRNSPTRLHAGACSDSTGRWITPARFSDR
jgi:MFS family permease